MIGHPLIRGRLLGTVCKVKSIQFQNTSYKEKQYTMRYVLFPSASFQFT